VNKLDRLERQFHLLPFDNSLSDDILLFKEPFEFIGSSRRKTLLSNGNNDWSKNHRLFFSACTWIFVMTEVIVDACLF